MVGNVKVEFLYAFGGVRNEFYMKPGRNTPVHLPDRVPFQLSSGTHREMGRVKGNGND